MLKFLAACGALSLLAVIMVGVFGTKKVMDMDCARTETSTGYTISCKESD